MKKENLVAPKEYYLLVCIVLFSLILRLLWLNAAIEGDEGFYGYEAMLWSKGYLPYVYATPTKMPLLYISYLIPIHFFGNMIMPIRMINNVLFLASLVILYFIAKDWCGKKAGLIAALFYGMFMNAPVFQAQQALSEPLSMPFVVFSIYFYNKYLKNGRKIILLVSGLLISTALLIHQGQAIGVIVLLLMMAFSRRESEIKLRLMLILLLGILLPTLFIVIFFWYHAALASLVECVARYLSNVRVLTFNAVPGLVFLLAIEGLPLWLFCIAGSIKSIQRSNIYDKFLMSWLLLFLFLANVPPLFGHHYVHVIAPASILAGVGLSSFLNDVKPRYVIKIFSEHKRNAKSITFIAVLILSVVPSIYFQFLQYPNFNIHWGFVNWDYGGAPGPWTYEKQLELGSYLRSHTSENGTIFVHAWWATPYWLSGHMAPSRYISTVKDPMVFTIPEEEFQRLATMVRNREFEYIVILSPDLESLKQRLDDPIVNYTLKNYVHVEIILNAQIFKVNATLTPSET